MFSDIAYLDWIVGRPEQAEYDLGSSDLRRTDADPHEVVPPAVADAPTPEATLEAQLADAYGVGPENVLVTAGATHANFLAATAALREAIDERAVGSRNVGGNQDAAGNQGVASSRDATGNRDTAVDRDASKRDSRTPSSAARVLVEKPGYEPLLGTPRGLGATVDRFRRPPEAGYPLDTERVTGAVVEDTALVTITNRHNPSGRRVGRDILAETARVVGGAGARLLVDEVYASFGGEPGDDSEGVTERDLSSGDEPALGPFDGPTAAGLQNTVVTNSLTKFLGFPGLRLGWLVADEGFVSRARRVKRHVPAVAEPSRLLARRALARAPELATDSRTRIRANHDALTGFLADRADLSGRVEPGCTYAFLEHEFADGTEVADAAWEQGVLVVPGRFFDDADGFRIGACRDPEMVRAGLDRLGEVLDSLDGE